MESDQTGVLSRKFRRIANETAELPGLRLFAKPMYRRWFNRPHAACVVYRGRYDSYAQARADAPQALPSNYDFEAYGRLFRDRFETIRVSDYPVVYWLSRLLQNGQRRIFDLGGHTGVSYYGFNHYLDYPPDMRWLVHDMPAMVTAGRAIAQETDPRRLLQFTDRRDDVDGCGVLLSSGTLQYLDYTLPELLQGLAARPPHVLINMTPMHPRTGYFTLQHMGMAICPYRVPAVPDFISAMEALGYRVIDRWESFERQLRIPFEPTCTIDRYYGFYFQLQS